MKNRHQWTLSANYKKIPSSVYLFHQNIQVFLSTVTIVLPKGDLREAGHLGNGAVGGSTLLDRPIVFGWPDELDVVFVNKR